MHIKRDISSWNIKIILSVLIGAGNPELLSTISENDTLRGLHHTILSAITDIYGQSTIYSVHIVNTLFGVFCNMFRYYVIISFFFTIKNYLILKYLINSW